MSSRNIPSLENIPLEIVHQIIKELDIKSRLNILQVNKKCYEIVVNLPDSLKHPEIYCDIKLSNEAITIKPELLKLDEYVNWTFHGWDNIFNLFHKFDCYNLFIDIQTEADEEKYCQFILKNQEHFKFSDIMINFIPSKMSYPDMWLEILSLFDTARFDSFFTRIDTARFNYDKTPLIIHADVIPVLEQLILKSPNMNNLSANFSINFCKEFLKQISEGLRPSFEELFIHDEKMVENDYQTFISGLTCEYRVIEANDYNATIDIPSLGYHLVIWAMNGAVEVLPQMRAEDIARMRNNHEF